MSTSSFQPPSDRPDAPAPPSRAPIEGGPSAPAANGPPDAPPEPPPRPGFDWLTEVLIPIAVFGLLGSFFYYLLDLRGAQGQEGLSGLRWVCFWFLLGAILTTRMRTRYGAHIIAIPYILGLALAMCVFIFHVTMYSGAFVGTSNWSGQAVALLFNYALVGVIWWVANLLTRATTAEENYLTVEDEGLLTAMRRKPTRAAEKTGRSRPRHPGWVLMWLSLVALITFALGQHVTAGAAASHQTHAFLCMVSYSFFALVLLALTSLSAMRMSARRRAIAVAKGITPVWTLTSTVIVLLVLAIAAFLPRMRVPERVAQHLGSGQRGWREAPETPWNEAPGWGSRKPRASPGGEQRSGELPQGAPGAEGQGDGSHPQPGDRGSPAATGGAGGERPGSTEAGGGKQGESGAQAGGESGEGGGGGEGQGGQGGRDSSGAPKSGTRQAGGQQSESPSGTGGTSNRGKGEERQTSSAGSQSGGQAALPSGQGQRQSSGKMNLLQELLLALLLLLGFLLLLLLLAYLIYRALKNRKQLPSFRAWAADLWAMTAVAVREALARLAAALARFLALLLGLFGWRPRLKLGADGLPRDPFADIFADRELSATLTPAQVVRHVYAALQAFCALIGYPRPDDQTPYEYARSLPSYLGGLPREDADRLTALYVKAAYSPTEVGAEEVAQAREVWEHLQLPIDQALAARRRPAAAKPAPSPA